MFCEKCGASRIIGDYSYFMISRYFLLNHTIFALSSRVPLAALMETVVNSRGKPWSVPEVSPQNNIVYQRVKE